MLLQLAVAIEMIIVLVGIQVKIRNGRFYRKKKL